MRRLLAARGVAVVLAFLAVALGGSNYPFEVAHADPVCKQSIAHTSSAVDYATTFCYDRRGWVYTFGWCFSVVWVVDNGVVVGIEKSYQYREGPNTWKAREAVMDSVVSRVNCTSSKPFIETKYSVYGLRPGHVRW